MKLSKQFTTVTPFSKYLALSLFIVLPMITFAIGYHAEKMFTHSKAAPSSKETSSVSYAKKLVSPTDPNTYFVQVSDQEISIRQGNLYSQEIGSIRYEEKTDSIYSPIWSSDGKKIAYVLTYYQQSSDRQSDKLFSDIYTVNADGTNSKKAGSYSIDNSSLITLVGFYPGNNTLAFFWVDGYPTAHAGSFSILDLQNSSITKIPEIPIEDISIDSFNEHQALKSSTDGNTFLIATNTHLYSYNATDHQLTTLYTLPQEDINSVHPAGDGPFTGGFFPLVQIDPGNENIYFTNNEIGIVYKSLKGMSYQPATNTLQNLQ